MITMLRDRVLIKPVAHKALSEIILTENSERTYHGEVIAFGPGKIIKGKRQPLDIKIGDIVLYCNAFKFPEIKFGEDIFQVLQEADIAGVIDDV